MAEEKEFKLQEQTLGLSLSKFVRELGNPYALIPEENQQALAKVLQNQQMIMQVVEVLEKQEMHKLLADSLGKLNKFNELIDRDERLEQMEDKDLINYGKHQTQLATKLVDLLREKKAGMVTNNLFLNAGDMNIGKSDMSADDRNALKRGLKKVLAKAAIVDAEENEGEVIEQV